MKISKDNLFHVLRLYVIVMLKLCIAQNFKISFEIFIIYHDFAMNIMGIKIKNVQSIFRKKVSMGLILHIMSSKILLGKTDAFLGRRYTIGKQCFSTDILWDEGPGLQLKT